jgi:hypothetical protein
LVGKDILAKALYDDRQEQATAGARVSYHRSAASKGQVQVLSVTLSSHLKRSVPESI